MLLSAEAITISEWELLSRLAVAAGLGAAVGLERELRDREAGIRTHLAVSLGSALFTIVSAYGFSEFVSPSSPVDPTRIAAQIVTGIGFLGAGAIIRSGLSVRGLTTAASLWIVAAVGMAAGAGYYWAAVIGTAITVFALGPLRIMAFRALEPLRPAQRRLVVELRSGTSVTGLLGQLGEVRSLEVDDEADRRVVTLDLGGSVDQQLVSRVSDFEDVIGVKWQR
jgi:putative Mg2+ transporter-C (MgtC) family protein